MSSPSPLSSLPISSRPSAGEAAQRQRKDGARLLVAELEGAVVVDRVARIVDQRDQRRDVLGRPVARHQLFARRRRIGRGADQLDDLVDVGDGHREADEDMGPVAGLVEQEAGAAGHHLLAELDERREHRRHVHQLGLAAVERDEVAAERALERREAVELVEHHVGHGIALQLDDDAQAVAVGLVADLGDALDALLAHEFAHLLDHLRLVHLIRESR